MDGKSRSRSVAPAFDTNFELKSKSSAQEWAILVLKACSSERDLKTLGDWARYVGVSQSTLRERCRIVKVQPHDARDFMRMLRTVLRASNGGWQPEAFLSIGDGRTLKRMLQRGGLNAINGTSPTVPAFVNRQAFLGPDNAGLAALNDLLLRVTMRWAES